MMKHMLKKLIWSLALCGIAVMCCFPAWGTELSVPELKTEAGRSVSIPVMIDTVDNLAGVKLSVTYDTSLLKFEKADKTRQSTSLMHIVNSKTPGTLIIVMAGAKGIKGKKFPILLLQFAVQKGLKETRTTRLEIKEVQLMSDRLKDIQAKIVTGSLTIVPQQPVGIRPPVPPPALPEPPKDKAPDVNNK